MSLQAIAAEEANVILAIAGNLPAGADAEIRSIVERAMSRFVREQVDRLLEVVKPAIGVGMVDPNAPIVDQIKAIISNAEVLNAQVAALREALECDIRAFWNAQAAWSRATFGEDHERGPIGPLKHLAKEAVEAQLNPKDIFEFVDCLFLIFDASRRAGFDLDQLVEAAWKKLEINKSRKWTKPTSDEPAEHDRSGEASQ